MMSSYTYGHVIQSSSLSKLQKLNTLFFVCDNFYIDGIVPHCVTISVVNKVHNHVSNTK